MTRLARNAPPSRPAEHGFALHVRWRVGARGLLTLVIRDATSASAEVTLSADAAAPSVRRWSMAIVAPAPRRDRDAGQDRDECRYALRSGDGAVSAQVTIVPTADTGALLLTDLPARLGLMGGTYVVESLHAE